MLLEREPLNTFMAVSFFNENIRNNVIMIIIVIVIIILITMIIIIFYFKLNKTLFIDLKKIDYLQIQEYEILKYIPYVHSSCVRKRIVVK